MLLSYNSGILFSYIIGASVTYSVYPYIGICFPLIYPFLIFFFPETPQSLIKKNKLEDARESLRFYRGIKPHEKMSSKYSTEFLQIIEVIAAQQETKVNFTDFSEYIR